MSGGVTFCRPISGQEIEITGPVITRLFVSSEPRVWVCRFVCEIG